MASPNNNRVIELKRMRWAMHVARMGEMRNAYKTLVGKPVAKEPLRIPRRRWEDNIRMDLRDIGRDVVDWMYLALDRVQFRVLMKTVMNIRVP
jgi:hypothetical protein